MVGADNMSNRTVAEGYVENYATLLRAQWFTSSKRRRRPRLWLWLMLDKSTRVHKELAKMHDRPTIQKVPSWTKIQSPFSMTTSFQSGMQLDRGK